MQYCPGIIKCKNISTKVPSPGLEELGIVEDSGDNPRSVVGRIGVGATDQKSDLGLDSRNDRRIVDYHHKITNTLV